MSDLADVCRQASAWPLPRSGRTLERWQALSALAEDDLVLARLAEAHGDAVAILAELGGRPVGPDERWGVWAAEVPGRTPVLDGSVVTGTKAWCSGATLLTHALVTVDGGALCAVALDGSAADPDEWTWAGMRGTDTRTVRFDRTPAVLVGEPGSYLSRPGFWVGGIGVAACWYGGAAALANPLRRRALDRPDPIILAHLGAVDVALGAARGALVLAAMEVDARPDEDHRRLARRVRSMVAATCTEVAARVGRALGPAPYVSDRVHSQRVADLEVYVRQDHAEHDLAALGSDVAAQQRDWSL
jgi:hypothetical protein